jgi:hypothetical protein
MNQNGPRQLMNLRRSREKEFITNFKPEKFMDTQTLIAQSKRTRLLGVKRILTDKENSLINQMNVMLDLIIMNTLEFNKLTSAGEIMEKLSFVHEETFREQDFDWDTDTIENICQMLCSNNGILIKLVKNNVNYYKLNHKNYL